MTHSFPTRRSSDLFGDDRGFFFESFNHALFEEAIGRTAKFVQDNHSKSAKNVLRGLHYQIQQAQGKLVRVVAGEVFDVAVRSEEHTSELQSLMRISYAVFCLKKKKKTTQI